MKYYRIVFHLYNAQTKMCAKIGQTIFTDNPTLWAKNHYLQQNDDLYATTITEVNA